MALVKRYNLARMTVGSAPGTGTITLGVAAVVNGVQYLSFANAGVADGDVVAYSIQDTNASEVGYGTYTASGTTLTRTPTKSTNGGSAINASASAQVMITVRDEDLPFNVDTAGTTVTLKSGITALNSGAPITAPNLVASQALGATATLNAALSNTSIPAGGNNIACPNSSALLFIRENTATGQCCLAIANGGFWFIIQQSGSLFVANSTSPTGNTYNLGFDTGYRIYNGTAGALSFSAVVLQPI